jgi:fatty-acyl-CoA synthase
MPMVFSTPATWRRLTRRLHADHGPREGRDQIGGEWISSIDIENAAIGHPAIAEAAVIGVAHPKWQERPLLVVVRKQGRDVSRDELLKFLDGKIAKWWMPDDAVFVDELPHTATGKLQKMKLREQFRSYKLPTA